MAVHEHKRRARANLSVGVITTSDTRTPDSDTSGRLIREMLEGAGHRVSFYTIVPDDAERIRASVTGNLAALDALILTGGTGIAPRDCTADVVRALLDKELPGFGQLFCALSYDEIGSAAFLSRAVAGVIRGKFVAALPGSTGGCRLAMEKLILPEIGHALWLLNPQ